MPETMAQTLARLQAANSDIGSAITAKGVTVPSGSGLEDYADLIAAIPSGGSVVDDSKPVRFLDYDGTVVYSYTAQEFAQLDSMPENPTHDDLTAQGWNWSLADAKTYVQSYGYLDIGQMYITSDGKTRIYITINEYILSPKLGLGINGSVDVDWGDGSAHDTMTGSDLSQSVYQSHTYASGGSYVISLTVTGSMAFCGTYGVPDILGKESTSNSDENIPYLNAIKKIEIGSGVTTIGTYAFNKCYSLKSVTIPYGVTDIGTSAFYGCYSLSNISIPSDVTSIGNNAFEKCYSITNITIPSSVTSIGSSAFTSCYVLTNITIPSDVTSIGGSAFRYCYALTNITIPSGVTTIGTYAFRDCCVLTNITIPSNVTSIGSSTFNNCSSLTSLTIPSGVTSIGSSAFDSCSSLTSLTIPSGVTSIGTTAFRNCYSLTSVTIPSSVTSIGSNAFQLCRGIVYLKFESETPPTLSGSDVFTIPTDCKIYVPKGYLSAYTSAQNYPSSSTYTYIEYDP